jgi:hypothetical protein
MEQEDMVLLREECSDGNNRACNTLQRLCETAGTTPASTS